MVDKVFKYYTYFYRFLKSPRKTQIVQELLHEIRSKGVLEGGRSLLHIKSNSYIPDPVKTKVDYPVIAKVYDINDAVSVPCSANPVVTIIIPNYNQQNYTYACVSSIVDAVPASIDYEIIVADDHSPEGTSLLQSSLPGVRIVGSSENLGFLRNCNRAASFANGKYLVLLNNDTRVLPNWLEELLVTFSQVSNAGIVGSKLIFPDGSLQEAGGIIWNNGQGANFGCRSNAQKPEYNYLKEVDYVSGASIMITKSLWDEIGGFDVRYAPAYCEDSDLCFQVRQRGLKVLYQPYSKVIHYEGVSHGKDTRTGVKQFQVINQKKFVAKWGGALGGQQPLNRNLFFARDRSAGKKHILVVDHNVPTIDQDAGSRTINNFVDTLLALGCKVHFLVPNCYPSQDYVKNLQAKGVEVLQGDDFLLGRPIWKDYFRRNMPYYHGVLLSRESVSSSHLKMLRAIRFKGKIIYYGHDLGYQRLEAEGALTGDTETVQLAKVLRERENYMYQNADGSLMISHDELEYLQPLVQKKLHYVNPYFFEVSQQLPPFGARNGLLFVGGFNHPPNNVGITWFLNEVYHQLHVTGIPLVIAGSKIPPELFAFQQRYPGLKVLPDVPAAELDLLYRSTRLAIVPLLSGAGVKGKVIEAMAFGVPVVGTDFAFQGMYRGHDFPYSGMNDPMLFAKEIIRLYNSLSDWDTLSRFNTQYVAEYFNKESMKKVLAEVFDL